MVCVCVGRCGCAAQVIFAGWNVLAKDLMRGGVNAMTFLAYRLLCASVVLLLYAYVVIRYVDRAPHVSILSVQRQHMVSEQSPFQCAGCGTRCAEARSAAVSPCCCSWVPWRRQRCCSFCWRSSSFQPRRLPSTFL